MNKYAQNRLKLDKYHSAHNDILEMNLDTELHYTLAGIISLMLESISYGKHRPTTAFDSDINFASRFCRYLLRDIRYIHKNSTQEKEWIKSSYLLDHCQFHCVLGISRC